MGRQPKRSLDPIGAVLHVQSADPMRLHPLEVQPQSPDPPQSAGADSPQYCLLEHVTHVPVPASFGTMPGLSAPSRWGRTTTGSSYRVSKGMGSLEWKIGRILLRTAVDQDVLAYFELVDCLFTIAHLSGTLLFMVQRAEHEGPVGSELHHQLFNGDCLLPSQTLIISPRNVEKERWVVS